MQTKGDANQDFSTGVWLLDSGMRPLYCNAEAVRILTYPEPAEGIKSIGSSLAGKIRSVLPDEDGGSHLSHVKEVISGRRRYQCRFVVLEYNPKGPSTPATAVLLERADQTSVQISKIAEQFHLTSREREAVKFLSEGLTSKEIAQRMGISPNTVKVFLRLVMIKMGVSTRAGIVAKTLHS